MSSYGPYSLDDESDELGSESTFSLRFDKSVDSVSVLRSEFSAPTGVKSKSDIFASDFFTHRSRVQRWSTP